MSLLFAYTRLPSSLKELVYIPHHTPAAPGPLLSLLSFLTSLSLLPPPSLPLSREAPGALRGPRRPPFQHA